MSDDPPAQDDGEWSYGDDKEGDRTQYGILIDSEAADFFQDMVKLANDGKIREKTGPELRTAMKYYTAIFFGLRPYDLDRVADGQVDYIRNPEEFVEIAERWSEDVGSEVVQVGNKTSETQSESSPSEPATLLTDESETQSEEKASQEYLTDSDEATERERLQEAVRILEEFLDRSGDEIPGELIVDDPDKNPDQNHQKHSESSREEKHTTESEGNDVLETDT